MAFRRITFFLIFVLLSASCVTETPVPTASPAQPPEETIVPTEVPPVEPERTPGRIVIDEVIPGVPGDNNYEFVELYNAGTEPVDLRGWSLWYRLADNQEEKRVFIWTAHTDVPGYGHYLLVRAGSDVGTVPDAMFNVPLFERKGGLVLRDADHAPVDALGWGAAPQDFVEGTPAPAPADGASLERKPGGEAGSAVDTGDNSADFVARAQPDPQNSGSPITPLLAQRLVIAGTAPASITPGTEFAYQIGVENRTGIALGDGVVAVPVPPGFEALAVPPEAVQTDGTVRWPLPPLADGERASWTLTLRSPWNYGAFFAGGYYVESTAWPLRAYGALVPITIEGGAIPIGTARMLEGKVVTVEGIATMYTGGFYAGSTGTKFYLQDDTGGIQVYCPGGADVVSVKIGDRVRVTGGIEVYRDSLEIIPSTYPDDVAVLPKTVEVCGTCSGTKPSDLDGAKAIAPPEPQPVTARAANSDTNLLGRLIVVEGTITRLEEFSYSYEIDLQDAAGDTIFVNIEKETNINSEALEVGKQYRITGISELYNAQWQLKPRLNADFVRVFPPELMLERQAQNSVNPGDLITYTITAYNHTPDTLTNVTIVSPPPDNSATPVAVLDDGSAGPLGFTWTLPELEGDGGSATVRYVVRAGDVDRIVAQAATATADQWPEPVATPPWTTFVGGGVPIWAIQGDGAASPYVHSTATVEGIVTGVFPKQDGFWVQSLLPDRNPATSEGLYVYAPGLVITATLGDHVQVTGKVREVSGQTLLYLQTLDDLVTTGASLPLPGAVELDPPQKASDATLYYEALEGMLVAVTEPAVVVAPTTQYGEYALVRQKWGIDRVRRGDPTGMLIFVDDGSSETHLDGSTLPYEVKTGDQVGGLLGPLAFTYDNYKIQPIITPTVVAAPVSLPAIRPAGPDELSLATFNTENLFDIVLPHPSSPPRPTPDEYRVRIARTAAAIEALGAPTIVGLQEVENIGVLEDLAATDALAGYGYVPVLIEGTDSRGIDVGYLVRGDRATLEGASAHPAPEGLTSRPPLLITVTVHLAAGDRTVYVLNNHFTSMSGGERATEPQRTAQAAWNVTLVTRLLAEHPNADVAVLGDLNSFYHSLPIDTLREGGLRHVYESVAPDIPYTYVFQGESETLDHILVTPSLYDHLVRVEALHIDADYPLPLPDDTAPWHTSDHDPLLAVFAFGE